MVGMTRFERATPSSQAKCATKLRYIPIFNFHCTRALRATSHKILNGSDFIRQSQAALHPDIQFSILNT